MGGDVSEDGIVQGRREGEIGMEERCVCLGHCMLRWDGLRRRGRRGVLGDNVSEHLDEEEWTVVAREKHC
jgi:hypothetical protein